MIPQAEPSSVETSTHPFDLLIVGGGINGVGIARDAAGRGLSVALCEQGDISDSTSSASSKLIHGGLRYLEHFQFRLVREALAEREILLRTAAHLVTPLRFVLPHAPQVRPTWKIRAGLFLYDFLSKDSSLPKSEPISFQPGWNGNALRPEYRQGFVYSDCLVDDARLVLLNARAAADLGAKVMVGTQCLQASIIGRTWRVTLRERATGNQLVLHARALVNAAGPWTTQLAKCFQGWKSTARIRLVKGSHIVVPRLHPGNHAYILQNDDGRVLFVIPYEESFSLIGTTEIAFGDPPGPITASAEEAVYLCQAVARFFNHSPSPRDIVWQYAGLRPLYDDSHSNPSAITRDYTIELQWVNSAAPLLTVYGGKLTTYRRLAERVLGKLSSVWPGQGPPWTESTPLPGADLPPGGMPALISDLALRYPNLPIPILSAVARRHGTLAGEVLAGADDPASLGEHFGAGLFAREVDYMIHNEWARTAEDLLWRRTKSGLQMGEEQRRTVSDYVARQVAL
ncbi:MAG: glycerol-3-phosphate dehydrogenase [Gammaproteobacteria bacterium]